MPGGTTPKVNIIYAVWRETIWRSLLLVHLTGFAYSYLNFSSLYLSSPLITSKHISLSLFLCLILFHNSDSLPLNSSISASHPLSLSHRLSICISSPPVCPSHLSLFVSHPPLYLLHATVSLSLLSSGFFVQSPVCSYVKDITIDFAS